MGSDILSGLLEKRIKLSTVFNWILDKEIQDLDSKFINSCNCSRLDFVVFYHNHLRTTLKSYASHKAVDVKLKSHRTYNEEGCKSKDVTTTETKNNQIKSFTVYKNCKSLTLKSAQNVKSSPDENCVTPTTLSTCTRQGQQTCKSGKSLPSPKSCFGDYLTANKCASNKKKKREKVSGNENICVKGDLKLITGRRINPTNLLQTNSSNLNPNNSFTFKDLGCELLTENDNKRNCFVDERLKVMSCKSMSPDSPSLYTVSKAISESKLQIVPNLGAVTFKNRLDTLVNLYAFLRNKNLILNILSDISLLLSVALERTSGSNDCVEDTLSLEKVDLKSIFMSIHNRVYFAVNVLENQFWNIFDRATLTFLTENSRLKHFFSKGFLADMESVCKKQQLEKIDPVENNLQPSYALFISETDNVDNFPNLMSFQAFRKQRDMFYEILHLWETNRFNEEWNFSIALGNKIKALLSLHQDPANFLHLARLFKAQLLVNTCNVTDENADSMPTLASVNRVDSKKLSRLNSRIVDARPKSASVNSPPTFIGYESFYKEFIIVSQSYSFINHLADIFVKEIGSWRDSNIHPSDLDQLESFSDKYLRNSYETYIKSMMVLAKFLGFVESLPYTRENVQLFNNFLNSQIQIRTAYTPKIRLREILQDAIDNDTLILVVPWIVVYLATLDTVTLRLPYFEPVIFFLFKVYSHKAFGQNCKLNIYYVYLIKLSLGWLFDLPHFPREKYYQFLSKKEEAVLTCWHANNFVKVVDRNILYLCCPYLRVFKALLYDGDGAPTNSVTVKHITPVSTVDVAVDVNNRRLLTQMEQAFLNGQSTSIRKTIDFIGERVASACVKQICGNVVPLFKTARVCEFKNALTCLNLRDNGNAGTSKVDSIIAAMASAALKDLRNELNAKKVEIINVRIGRGMDSLLPNDLLDHSKQVCCVIAERYCHERVQHWIDSNICESIFKKEFESEFKKYSNARVTADAPSTNDRVLDLDVDSSNSFYIIQSIRECSLDLIEKPNLVSKNEIERLLDQTVDGLNKFRSFKIIVDQILKLLFDLSILLVAQRPQIISDDSILNHLCTIWDKFRTNNTFDSVVNPRNLTIICKASNIEESCGAFRYFIIQLIECKQLSYEALKSQIVQIDENCLEKLFLDKSFLTTLLEDCKVKNQKSLFL